MSRVGSQRKARRMKRTTGRRDHGTTDYELRTNDEQELNAESRLQSKS
jgi:hypothetical protein